jgi:hypothetical protein
MYPYSRELLGYAVALFACYGVFVRAGLGLGGWSRLFVIAGTALAHAVMVIENIQPGRLVGSGCIRVALFCLLAIAAGWGGFHLLLRTGLPAALFGNGAR